MACTSAKSEQDSPGQLRRRRDPEDRAVVKDSVPADLGGCRSCSTASVLVAIFRQTLIPRPAVEEQQSRARDEHRGVGSDDHADQHGEGESFEHVVHRAVVDEQNRDDEEGRQRGENRSGSAMINRQVDDLGVTALLTGEVLANAVKHHNRVVQRVTNDGQEGGHPFPG